MRLFATLLRQEWRTQLRSSRFALLATVYVLISCASLIVTVVLAVRGRYFVGAAAFAESLLLTQPFATSLFAAALSVDAISREIDDGSFAVTSINPITNSRYVAGRWAALLVFIAPLSLLPQVVGWGAAQYFHAGSSPLPFLLRWIVFVLPPLVAISAFSLGMGTVTGRTLIAAIATFLLTIVVLSFGNDYLARFHRTLEGPGEFIGVHVGAFTSAIWLLRGYGNMPRFGSDAGFESLETIDDALPAVAIPFGFAAGALAFSTAFLRRTRRDVRPRPVRPDHPLRTYLRMFNRLREEYAPDPKLHSADRTMMTLGVIALALAVAYLMTRAHRYELLAAERFSAESSGRPEAMSPSLLPVELQLRATFDSDGGMTSSSELTIRNSGREPQQFLSFQLNEALRLERVDISSGRVTTTRRWDRIAVVVAPPIRPGQSCRLRFSIAGVPSVYEFNLHGRGSFLDQYRYYQHASKAIDLSDLSRSHTARLATPIRVDLGGADLTPVPRYTPWTIQTTHDDPREGMEKLRVTAPRTGRLVVTHLVAPGAVVDDGISLGEIVSGDAPVVETAAASMDRDLLAPGLPVAFAARGGRTWKGTGRIAEVASTLDANGTARVVSSIDRGTDPAPVPGSGVELEVSLQRRPDALTVPEEAIVAGAEGAAVFVVAAAGQGQNTFRVRRAAIETGGRGGGRVEVRSGLRDGDRVIVAGADALSDNAFVYEAATPSASQR